MVTSFHLALNSSPQEKTTMTLYDHDLDALMTEFHRLSILNCNECRISHPSQTQHQCLYPLAEVINEQIEEAMNNMNLSGDIQQIKHALLCTFDN